MENNKNKKSVKFQGDMLNFCDFIQVFVFTPNHHLNIYYRRFLHVRKTELQIRGVLMIIQRYYFLFLYKNICCDPALEPSLGETALMMGHNICFKGAIWKIIPKLPLLPLLIWSTDWYLKVPLYIKEHSSDIFSVFYFHFDSFHLKVNFPRYQLMG